MILLLFIKTIIIISIGLDLLLIIIKKTSEYNINHIHPKLYNKLTYTLNNYKTKV